jgi:hypothetical protein
VPVEDPEAAERERSRGHHEREEEEKIFFFFFFLFFSFFSLLSCRSSCHYYCVHQETKVKETEAQSRRLLMATGA